MAIGDTQIYAWTDVGAPSITLAGLGNDILKAILVNGYNSKVITSLVVSGNTATVTSTAHGRLTGDWINGTGANESYVNGDFKITVTDTDHYTYVVSGADATATGTITHKKAAAGWTNPFNNGTTDAVFKSPVLNRYIVFNNVSSSYDQVTGYSTLTNFTSYASNNGTDKLQGVWNSTGSTLSDARITKGTTASCPWIVIAKDGGKLIHILIGVSRGYSTPLDSISWYYSWFGEFKSNVAGDTYNFALVMDNYNLSWSSGGNCMESVAIWLVNAKLGILPLRAYNQTTVQPQMIYDVDINACGKLSTNTIKNSPNSSDALLQKPNNISGCFVFSSSYYYGYPFIYLTGSDRPYPEPIAGGIDLRKANLYEVSYGRRGEVQGLYFPAVTLASLTNGNRVICNSGNLNGKTFQLFTIAIAGGKIAIDVT